MSTWLHDDYDQLGPGLADACRRADAKADGDAHADDPPVDGPEDYELPSGRNELGILNTVPVSFSKIPTTFDQWLDRVLPPPDCIMGSWLTTTSRALLSAATGLGKTNFVMALNSHMAEGKDFLHWRAHRPARVLYIDGEMSTRLLKARAEDVVRRIGHRPANMMLLSREDVPNFPPLNSPAGLPFIKAVVGQFGPFDFITFDNIMALTFGDQKDPLVWQQTLPVVEWLTKGAIGQLWVHHAGQDASKSYGDKTREWRMDVCAHLTEVKRVNTDVSFELEFRKARDRTPQNRRNFETVAIALVDDQWTCSAAAAHKTQPTGITRKFLEALQDTLSGDETTLFQGWPAVTMDAWRAECERHGLLDRDKPHSARTLFSRHRLALIAAGRIACNNDLVWMN